MFEAVAQSRASGGGNSWLAFVIANLVTATVTLPIFGRIRYLTAWELAQFLGFVLAASLAVTVALRWLRGLFGSSGPRFGAASGVGVGVGVLIPMIAPTILLRPPPNHNESATLGDMRTLMSAEAAYQAASGGYYGPPECLVAPPTCLHGYPVNLPTFLDSQLASRMPKSGYRRAFHPGAPAPPPADGKPGAKGGLVSYAYVAVPLRPGLSGVRGFCGDSTGRICFTVDGSAPPVTDGLCDPQCADLR
jgi:hypothetical protein